MNGVATRVTGRPASVGGEAGPRRRWEAGPGRLQPIGAVGGGAWPPAAGGAGTTCGGSMAAAAGGRRAKAPRGAAGRRRPRAAVRAGPGARERRGFPGGVAAPLPVPLISPVRPVGPGLRGQAAGGGRSARRRGGV